MNANVNKITLKGEPNLMTPPKYRIGDAVRVDIKVSCEITGEADIERTFYISSIFREPGPVPHYEYFLVDDLEGRVHRFYAAEDDIDGA